MSFLFKFFLQDTKSSNGTFVNNVRLSKGSEESEPKQIKSGDIVQFGVDVVENSKKGLCMCLILQHSSYYVPLILLKPIFTSIIALIA